VSLLNRALVLDSNYEPAGRLLARVMRRQRYRMVLGVAAGAALFASVGWLALRGDEKPLAVSAPPTVAVSAGVPVTLIEPPPLADAGAVANRSAAASAPLVSPSKPRTPSRAPAKPVEIAVADAGAPAEPSPSASTPPTASASVRLVLRQWCDVRIDGVAHGRADRDKPIELAPGHHHIVCSQGPGLGVFTSEVNLRAGEQRVLEGDVVAPVEVTVELGADQLVTIDGIGSFRNRQSARLRPGRYRLSLDGGKDSSYVSITTSCVIRGAPLGCYPK
jgi:hypothetical protein